MAMFPYTVVPKSLRPLLNHIQGAGVPPKVTQQYLAATGFKSTNDRAMIGVLKFIGFTDGAGAPTEVWRKFRSKASGGVVLANAIKSAYKSLFETYPNANERPNSVVRDFMSSHSSAGDRVLDAMVGTFKALCEAAKFEGASDSNDDLNEAEPENADTKVKEKPVKHRAVGVEASPQIIVNVQLVVPATDDPAIYDSFFDAMKRHLLKSND